MSCTKSTFPIESHYKVGALKQVIQFSEHHKPHELILSIIRIWFILEHLDELKDYIILPSFTVCLWGAKSVGWRMMLVHILLPNHWNYYNVLKSSLIWTDDEIKLLLQVKYCTTATICFVTDITAFLYFFSVYSL